MPVLDGVLPLPVAEGEFRLKLRRKVRFWPLSRELLGDGGGDEDGLCEAGEGCLVMPSIGAFQGEGTPEPAGSIEPGIELFQNP